MKQNKTSKNKINSCTSKWRSIRGCRDWPGRQACSYSTTRRGESTAQCSSEAHRSWCTSSLLRYAGWSPSSSQTRPLLPDNRQRSSRCSHASRGKSRDALLRCRRTPSRPRSPRRSRGRGSRASPLSSMRVVTCERNEWIGPFFSFFGQRGKRGEKRR